MISVDLDTIGYPVMKQQDVILLLGTMGSRLSVQSSDGKSHPVWPPFNPLRRYGLESLRLGESHCRVEATGLMDQPPFDYVTPLQRLLGKNGFNLIPFAYDWRQSISSLAADLGNFLDRRPMQSHIIGVSTGGLIVTRLAQLGGHHRLEKFISIGTPFLGMLRALANLTDGRVVSRAVNWYLAPKALPILRSHPGVYQALPHPKYFQAHSRPLLTTAHAAGTQALSSYETFVDQLKQRPWADARCMKEMDAFHQDFNPDMGLQSIETSFLIGSGIPTYVGGTWNLRGDRDQIDWQKSPFGDGAVSLFSQCLGGKLQSTYAPQQIHYLEANHRVMHMSPAGMQQIINILQGSHTRVEGVRNEIKSEGEHAAIHGLV